MGEIIRGRTTDLRLLEADRIIGVHPLVHLDLLEVFLEGAHLVVAEEEGKHILPSNFVHGYF